MAAWSSYSLRDFLLFSRETYFRLFELLNAGVWPAHIVALAFGMTAFALILRRGPIWPITLGLAACWLWVAWVFHFQHYATINWAAPWFGWAFVGQALLLLIAAWKSRHARAFTSWDPPALLGCAVFGFSLLGYPPLAPLAGRPWVGAEVFGIAPDPTALATLCLVLAARLQPVWLLWPIPLAWCLFAGLLGWAMGAYSMLLPAALAVVLTTALALYSLRPVSTKES